MDERQKFTDKIAELSDIVGRCSIAVNYKSLHDSISDNPDALAVLSDLVRFGKILADQEQNPENNSVEKKETPQDMDERLKENPIVKDYLQAQKKYLFLLQSIQSVLSAELKGEV